ncbi:MAG: hypothetical protein ABSG65_10920 [Bryobacteraceae bacterium]|jgi:hypothetical protein
MASAVAVRKPFLVLLGIAAVCWMAPPLAYSQTTLTGAMWYATNSSGATSVTQAYADGALNTLGGDQWWDLWLALNPDATSPVNGPSDAQASISIPLQAGQSYKYYIFGQGPCCNLNFSGLNLFFDNNGSTPGISAYGVVDTSGFRPDSSSTLTLQGTSVPGSGTAFYSSAGVIVVLTGYNWNASGTPPGDVCQEFAFSPAAGDVPSTFGSFSLQVFPAASLSLSQASGSPGTELTFTGSGFAANETVDIYAGQLSTSPIHATMTDASGDFTLTLREPQISYGLVDVYVEGVTSGALGAATLSVTAALGLSPRTASPGASVTAYGVGFGAGETVDIYWNNPRQLLGTATTDAHGSGALTIAVPPNASPGINGVIGIGQDTKAIGLGRVTVE